MIQSPFGAADVRIRPYVRADAGAIFEAVRESLTELEAWMPWAHQRYAFADARAWLEIHVPAFERGSAYEFAIVTTGGDYLGGCGLNQIDTANRRANLGYWVRTSACRRGVCTAAVQQLRAWAFASTDLLRLEIVVASGNLASQRVAEKAGALREGLLRSRLMLHGAARDALMFSLVR